MSRYRQILYHIVFRTKDGQQTLNPDQLKELLAYFMGILRNKDCFVYSINGMEDHMHILCDLNPAIALADLMRDIKTSTSLWLKRSGRFPGFSGWANGYAALTYTWRDKDMIVNYIKNQQEHHRIKSFEDELRRLLIDHGIEITEKYFP
jgi:putative transposase